MGTDTSVTLSGPVRHITRRIADALALLTSILIVGTEMDIYVIGTNILLSDYILSARLSVAFMAEQTYRVTDENGNGQFHRLLMEEANK